jgi:4-amino-4-deoxychorismate lyase
MDPNLKDEFWWAPPALRNRLRADPAGVLKERGTAVADGFPTAAIYDLLRMQMIVWQDGRLVPADRFTIDPFDEGLLLGRGVWDSARTFGGHPWMWNLHLERMANTAKLLGMDLTADRLPGERMIFEFVRTLTSSDVVVRLNASAGRPGKPGSVWMSCSPLPPPIASFRLKTARNPVTQPSPYLIGKTFHYAARMYAAKPAWQAGFDSLLWLDANDNLLESAHANVFVRLPEGWVTPSAESGLFLPGTVRHYLVKGEPPFPIREATVPRSRLDDATELFLTNGNVGIVPVVAVDERTYPVGEETRQFAQWLLPKKS